MMCGGKRFLSPKHAGSGVTLMRLGLGSGRLNLQAFTLPSLKVLGLRGQLLKIRTKCIHFQLEDGREITSWFEKPLLIR